MEVRFMFPFADSTNPEAIDEAEFSHVAAYGNGRFKWPDSELARFPKHILISVETGNPGAAQFMRALDMERYDANAFDFPGFADTRTAFGHDDALGYSSILGNGPDQGIAAIMHAMQNERSVWGLWVAWWWGRNFPPTVSEVLAEIKALTGIDFPAHRLKACQWRNGPDLDTSIWYQSDTFTASGLAVSSTAEVEQVTGG